MKIIAALLPVLLQLLLLAAPAGARSREGDKLLAQARAAQGGGKLEAALRLAEEALRTDPQDAAYSITVERLRIQVAKARTAAAAAAAAAAPPAPAPSPERSGLEEFGPPPRLKTLARIPRLCVVNQTAKVIFETLGKAAGLYVIFDSVSPAPPRTFSLDLADRSVEQALDDAALLTKSFWKPISDNSIFVTPESPTARRDYEDQAVKVVYLRNSLNTQEMNELITAVRTALDLRRMFLYAAQGAVIIRGTGDQVLLAEKLIREVDRPRSEVVIEVFVMETTCARSREITSALSGSSGYGLTVPVTFTPRGTSTTSSTTTSTTTTISLAGLSKLSSSDFSASLPGALVNLIASDRETRILQSPQLRSIDGQKATLKVGQRIPFATGSYNTGGLASSGTSLTSLVSTQFQYADVGVNVDLVPKVHSADELTLHIEVEVSSVADRVDLGGISQPVIGQRKVMHDVRLRDGEAALLAGLNQNQESGTRSGVPRLIDVPILRSLFGSNTSDKSRSDLMIVLVPHILRAGVGTGREAPLIGVGTEQNIKLAPGGGEGR